MLNILNPGGSKAATGASILYRDTNTRPDTWRIIPNCRYSSTDQSKALLTSARSSGGGQSSIV